MEARTADGDVISYEYNNENIRVSSSINGAKTTYLVDANRPYAQVLEEYEDENLKVRYVHGLDLISVEQSGVVSIYLVDGLGSTRVLVDENGEVVAGYTYEAFGELIDESGDVENSYLFAGEQFDGELGQYYLRDRYYDAGVGRFTRRDTYEGSLNEPITLHKYLYGNANPVNYVDPSGFIAISEQVATFSLLDALIGISLVGAVVLELAEEDDCNYTIDEHHIFSPDTRSGTLQGFHSTARATEGLDYNWVGTPPDMFADYEPFVATFEIPEQPNFGVKQSTFFPMKLSYAQTVKLIGSAYIQSGCIPTGDWFTTVTNPLTGEAMPVFGYARMHQITTAYPSQV